MKNKYLFLIKKYGKQKRPHCPNNPKSNKKIMERCKMYTTNTHMTGHFLGMVQVLQCQLILMF